MKKRILVGVLNWGLGHATRCIPIINALKQNNFTPIIASEGQALKLLQKEFPDVEYIKLPEYNITYSKKAKFLKLKLLLNSPKALHAIRKEKAIVDALVEQDKIDGIICDNKMGVYSKKVPSVFITHQLKVLSGNTTWLSTKVYENFITKFNECWVPDTSETPNLSGDMAHSHNLKMPIKYIGAISRFKAIKTEILHDILVLISGPEPQRSLLEDKLLSELKTYNGKVLFVKGKIENQQTITTQDNFTIYNYMKSDELELAINQSNLVVSRSGYTTVLDLACIGKKAFFIPTPGQFEQEYIAKRLTEQGLVLSSTQDKFKVEMLNEAENFKGLSGFTSNPDYTDLFSLF